MKISLDWLSDFVDLSGISPEKVADQLTLSTAEVEGFEVLERHVEGVVIGEVLAAEPIAAGGGKGDRSTLPERPEGCFAQIGPVPFSRPEAARLQLATVDCGRRRFVTVCGAPNLRVGMKAPFAPPGVTLAGGMKIATSQLAGHRSEGVLCSAMELGMSRWHEVVLECPAGLPTGAPLAQFVPDGDVVIEIDNKSLTHRPDLWGHYAFARELSAIFHRPLRPMPMADLARFDHLPLYPLAVDDPEGCPCYGCIEFGVMAAVASPLVIQRRLHALGQRTYNLLVDVTNYVMLELAQPTHAFDGGLVRAIRVAPMGRAATFTTLDGQERPMLSDDLLIWDERQPVALAGVMGGLHSEIRPNTARVLLESANFKASRIRRTSVRLDLRTDAAQRFEKSQPPANVKAAVGRILRLIEDAGARPEVSSRFTVAGDLKEAYRPLAFSRQLFRSMAGQEIPDGEVVRILESLGFQARFDGEGDLQVGIPPHRSEKDISIPADIVEEVLRIYGYGKIEPRMPQVLIEPLYVEKRLRIEHKLRRLLGVGHRFVEVQNYGWFDDPWLAELGFQPERTLVLKNPSARQNRLLRTTLLPNLLALVRPNRVHRDAFRLFEIGRVYALGDDGACVETSRLAGLSFQAVHQPSLEEHFRAIRGVMEDLGRVIGRGAEEKGTGPICRNGPEGASHKLDLSPFPGLEFVPQAGAETPWELPGQWVELRLGGRPMGGLGILQGPILQTVAHEGQVVWFELAMDDIEGPIYPQLDYVAPPIYPGSWQDFSLVWDLGQGFAALDQRLKQFSHPLVMRREFLYLYKGKGLAPGTGSYSFRYWLGAMDHTLTSDEIDGFRTALLGFLNEQGLSLRG